MCNEFSPKVVKKYAEYVFKLICALRWSTTDWADITKLPHGEKLFVKKNCTEFRENLTNGLVPDIR
jgi:hypothetical protein